MSPTLSPCEAARRVAAACRLPEAGTVLERVSAALPASPGADVLWLTWVQWRALGRQAMTQETGLSLWTINDRLRRLRQAGAPVLSWAEEQDLMARGRFHQAWV